MPKQFSLNTLSNISFADNIFHRHHPHKKEAQIFVLFYFAIIKKITLFEKYISTLIGKLNKKYQHRGNSKFNNILLL